MRTMFSRYLPDPEPRLPVGVYCCPRCGSEVEVLVPAASVRCPTCFGDLVLSTTIVAR